MALSSTPATIHPGRWYTAATDSNRRLIKLIAVSCTMFTIRTLRGSGPIAALLIEWLMVFKRMSHRGGRTVSARHFFQRCSWHLPTLPGLLWDFETSGVVLTRVTAGPALVALLAPALLPTPAVSSAVLSPARLTEL